MVVEMWETSCKRVRVDSVKSFNRKPQLPLVSLRREFILIIIFAFIVRHFTALHLSLNPFGIVGNECGENTPLLISLS